jgi:uncharacterized protein
MKRILITGGAGLIGRALATELAKDGNQVVVLSRSPERIKGLPAGVSAAAWNGRSAEGWGSLLDGIDAVVNLAGENISSGRWTEQRKRLLLESRLNAGQAVVQAVEMASVKPEVVIQASAVGYYGPRGDQEIKEETPAGHDFLAEVAAEWEASTQPVERLGVRRAIIRTGVVLSPDGGALERMLLPFRLFIGGRMGSGRQWFPWIHIADEVAAIRFLIDSETASGPFNLTAPVPLTNAEFTRLLGKQLKKPTVMPIPGFALRVLFGEMATVLLDGQKALPVRLLNLGFTFQFREAGPALNDLLVPK